MKESSTYTLYHPKWYRKRVSTYWWTRQWSHFRFILREISSIFVAYFVVMMLLLLRALSKGPESYAAFQAWLKTPLAITLNVISLLFVIFHTITWFNLTPSAMPLRLGGKRVPDWMITAPNYVAWVIVSIVVAWFVLGGN